MYTFTHNKSLFVLNEKSGRVYRVQMSIRNEPQFIHFDTLQFEADVQRYIKDFKAVYVEDHSDLNEY